MSLVTLSASYGAGGSRVAPALAKRLGVPFVDRVIPSEVAARLAITPDAALSHSEGTAVGFLTRLLMSLGPMTQEYGVGGPASEPVSARCYRETAEQVIHERADSGQGVILGRAGALVLHHDPRALHVRLDGPCEARVRQAMRLEGIERGTAERRMKETDRARYAYVRHFRRADARDPSLYHLIIDSTAIDLAVCVEILAHAAEARAAEAHATAVAPPKAQVAGR